MTLLICFMIIQINSACQPDLVSMAPKNNTPVPSIFNLERNISNKTPMVFPTPSNIHTPGTYPTSNPLTKPTILPFDISTPAEPDIFETHESLDGIWTIFTTKEWQDLKLKYGETVAISTITIAKDSTFWFGTTGSGGFIGGTGVYHFDGKTWNRYTTQNGLPTDEISSILFDQDNAIWFGTKCCGVSRFDGKTWTNYTEANGLASNDIRSSAIAPDGSLWFGTSDKGVSRFDGEKWQTFSDVDGLWGSFVGHIAVLPDGDLLFSTSNGYTARINRFDGKSWRVFQTPWESSGVYTEDISTGPDGTTWFATERDGVYRLKGDTWIHYTVRDGLVDNSVYAIQVTPEGAVWLGTNGGVCRFDGKFWTTFTTEDGLLNNWIGSIAVSPDGTIWFGSAGGVYRYRSR
jgi:ligand-binding sensor domain-containing protein